MADLLTRRGFLAGAAAFAAAGDRHAGDAAPSSCSYFDPALAQAARAKAVAAGRCETLWRASGGRHPSPADVVDEISVFGKGGWATRYPADVRKGLDFLMPAGWDEAWRFPSLSAAPPQRLRDLRSRLVDGGWHGLSLRTPRSDEESTKRRLAESAEAGAVSWVVADEQGRRDLEWLGRLRKLRDECCPGLMVECEISLDDGEGMVKDLLETVDIVRIGARGRQDFLRSLADCARAVGRSGGRTLLNVGDHVFAGAALGHALGITRYLADGATAVQRAVRWQELSPAFGESPENRTLVGADGSIARGLPQPLVTSPGGAGVPSVLSARSPNGCLSVCATTPQAAVVIDAPLEKGASLGIFGEFASITLRLGATVGERPRMVLAADLAGGCAENVLANVRFGNGRMTLDGTQLSRLGRKRNRRGDNSPPAVLVRLA